MAQLEALNIQLTADVKGLTSSIAKAEKSLSAFDATASKASTNVTKSLAATATSANKVDSSLANYSKGGAQATQATVNLSRVLQDAPFGFIGIANNLNPLLESFQRLGKESGGLKAALSALGSSMLGAGGIGLALSAFQFFALGGVDAIKKMFGALGDNKAVAEARKEMEEFNKSLKGAESGALATGLKLQSFVDIAKNGQLPLTQRNEALEQANKILGEHGTKLTLANVATKAITDQTKLYTEALIAQAVAAKFADRIADLTVQQATVRQKSIKESGELQKKTLEETNKLTERYSRSGKNVDISRIIDVGAEKNKLKETLEESTSLSIQLQGLKNLFAESTNSATKLFGALGTNKDDKTGSEAKKIQSEADKIAEIVKKLYADIAALNVLNKNGFITSIEFDNKSVDEYKKAVEDIAKISPTAIQITDLSIEIQPTILALAIAKYRENISKLGLETISLKSKIEVDAVIIPKGQPIKNAALAAFDKLREDTANAAAKLNSDIDGILANTFAASLSNFGESLGQLISGKISVGDLFGGLFSVLGQGIQQLGKTLIEYGVLAKIAKTSFATAFKNPVGAIVAGIALTAFGSVVKSAGALKLADGGFVSGKGTSRSDSIPAMLSNGEYVINAAAVRKFGLNNLDKINSLQGFAAGGVIGVPQPYAVPNNNVNISNSGIVVAIEGEFKMRNDMLALAVKKGNKTVSINS